ncbi:MAG: hypothetical protein M1826_002363 [Phylliscum demangeonii]|nr:MAG: hypothetical protein M1826_002363 [Phylliscum demangeonii]
MQSPQRLETPSVERASHLRSKSTDRPARASPVKATEDAVDQRTANEEAGLRDYQLGDCLGKGAFASVYRALNWGTGETVAVKKVRLADLPKTELRVIMLEIDLLKNLNHANIVKYHGFVKSPEYLFIILEYCENGSLHSICKNFGKFPENLVGLYMSQVLNGLLYLHDQGVIHRDIKGANILTTKEGLVKLADFGVATRASGLHESSVVGTPYWMAPEVIELSGATTASDIWSLGCTVIELLEGKPPYHTLQPMPALFRIVNDDHPPLPEGASPAVRDFLMQCFQKDPNLRVSARKLLKHPWIVNARRSDSVVPAHAPKYDEAVKSVQQWNAALRSPDPPAQRKASRPPSLSPIPVRRDATPTPRVPALASANAARPADRLRQAAETFHSPVAGEDNWDDDFDAAISPSALHLPHLRPHDNFGGMLSAEKLKAYAASDATADKENWDDQFEGDLTVRTPFGLLDPDPLRTIRPLATTATATGAAAEGEGAAAAATSAPKPNRSRASSPKKARSTDVSTPLRRRPPTLRPDDLVDDDAGDAFTGHPNVLKPDDILSPRLFHPSDLKRVQRPAPSPFATGSLRHALPTVNGPNDSSVRRIRSSVEIQRYAEDEQDEDYSDVFGTEERIVEPASSESNSDRGTLMLNSKLSSHSWLGDEDDSDDPFAELEEGFDEMDLQANIARDKHARLCTQVEGLVASLKTTQADEVLADLSEQLVSVAVHVPVDPHLTARPQMDILSDSPETKGVIVSAHGMLPILEVLESCPRREVILRLLKIVNAIIFNNVEIQENLCFVGGIPIISKFAAKRYSSEIRLEAAAFVRQMYQTSTLTLQMFVSCGGLNVLVEFLEEDYEAERDLVLIGVNGVWSVFELQVRADPFRPSASRTLIPAQGPTPKNDFCRIFSRSSVLYPLSLVLNRVLEEEGELAELCEGRIVNIFYLFSQAENHVKEMVADRMVLKRVLKDLKRMSPTHQITMLKFIKNLSMLSTTLDALQNSNAIEVLTDLLGQSINEPHSREICNQVLNTMFNLCRLSKPRQEDAALNGIIPLLQRIVQTERPLKEFAYPILCDMAHSGKVGRKILWQNKGLAFYISLMADPYWQVTALDAIFIWLQEETARVEEHLLRSGFTAAVVECFTNSKANALENLLEPLQKVLRLSPLVARSLGRPDLFARILPKVGHHKAVIRLNLLRIVRSICDASDEHGGLLRTYGLFDAIQKLAETDSAVLVRNMAGELVKSALERDQHASSVSRRRTLRRASASTSAIYPHSPSAFPFSCPPTPLELRPPPSAVTSYFDPPPAVSARRPPTSSGLPLSSSSTSSSSAFRPTSRDGASLASVFRPTSIGDGSLLMSLRPASRDSSSGSGSNSNSGSTGSRTAHGPSKIPPLGHSRLPRSSSSRRLAPRMSLALGSTVVDHKAENKVPNPGPTSAPLRLSPSRVHAQASPSSHQHPLLAASQRRRRPTVGAVGEGKSGR